MPMKMIVNPGPQSISKFEIPDEVVEFMKRVDDLRGQQALHNGSVGTIVSIKLCSNNEWEIILRLKNDIMVKTNKLRLA